MSDQTVHLGRNIKRIREMLHIKQETMAIALGEDWTQQRVSLLEGKEDIETKLLDQIAKALKVTPDAIKNFSEEAAINVFSNTFNDHAVNNANYQCDINPLEKYVQAIEENKQLYAALLKEKDEKIQLLERLVAELNRSSK
jgi:transcriptional regulator with XRE-family HTH domain